MQLRLNLGAPPLTQGTWQDLHICNDVPFFNKRVLLQALAALLAQDTRNLPVIPGLTHSVRTGTSRYAGVQMQKLPFNMSCNVKEPASSHRVIKSLHQTIVKQHFETSSFLYLAAVSLKRHLLAHFLTTELGQSLHVQCDPSSQRYILHTRLHGLH